jgi:hypothetical protein
MRPLESLIWKATGRVPVTRTCKQAASKSVLIIAPAESGSGVTNFEISENLYRTYLTDSLHRCPCHR